MNRKELSDFRHRLEKTQVQMAQLLGISLKALQSFEQGWRKVPAATERQVLVLLALKKTLINKKRPCWSIKHCPDDIRHKCPAWEFQAGYLCWFMNGTLCKGAAQKSWEEKMKACRKCEVFQSIFDLRRNSRKTRMAR